MYIFDTDHLGIVQWQSEPEYTRLINRVARHSAANFFVTVVTFHEEILGWNAYIAAKKSTGVVEGYRRLLQILTEHFTDENNTMAEVRGFPESKELSAEEVTQAYKLAREAFTAQDLQRYFEPMTGVDAEGFLAELEAMRVKHIQS